jgi:hypothetical protein
MFVLELMIPRLPRQRRIGAGEIFGATAFVALDGWPLVVAVDTHSRHVLARIPVGEAPRDLAIERIPGGCVPAEYTPVPTYTPTPTATSTPTKRPTPECPAAEPCLQVGSATLRAGESASIGVTLRTGGRTLVGVDNDLHFDSRLPLHDCEARPGLIAYVAFRYEPSFRAIILSAEPLSEGVLYTCAVRAAADLPPGLYPLLLERTDATNPQGDDLRLAGTDGMVVIEGESAAGGGAPSGAATSGGGCQAGRSAGVSLSWVVLVASAATLRRRERRSR